MSAGTQLIPARYLFSKPGQNGSASLWRKITPYAAFVGPERDNPEFPQENARQSRRSRTILAKEWRKNQVRKRNSLWSLN